MEWKSYSLLHHDHHVLLVIPEQDSLPGFLFPVVNCNKKNSDDADNCAITQCTLAHQW